ncbi:hypothetical protein Hanom_Chr13g01235991 [Helianthus anomalus]
MGSSVMSSVFAMTPTSGSGHSKGCMGDSTVPCMDNSIVAAPLSFEDHVQNHEFYGEQLHQPINSTVEREVNEARRSEAVQEERENVGLFDNPSNLEPNQSQQAQSNSERPSLITVRPNRKNKLRTKEAHTFVTPDLNFTAVEEDSDPFNISEVIRQIVAEEKAARSAGRAEGHILDNQMNFPSAEGVLPPSDPSPSDDFEKEVENTIEFGKCLGIGVDSFDNHVRNLINGEKEQVCSQ